MRKLLIFAALLFVFSCLFGCAPNRSPEEEDFYDHFSCFCEDPDIYLDIYVSKKVNSYEDALGILSTLVYDDGYVSQNDAEDALVYLARYEELVSGELYQLLNEYEHIR